MTLAEAIFEGALVDNSLYTEPYFRKVGRDLRRVRLFVLLDIVAFIRYQFVKDFLLRWPTLLRWCGRFYSSLFMCGGCQCWDLFTLCFTRVRKTSCWGCPSCSDWCVWILNCHQFAGPVGFFAQHFCFSLKIPYRSRRLAFMDGHSYSSGFITADSGSYCSTFPIGRLVAKLFTICWWGRGWVSDFVLFVVNSG